jgi:pyrimidine-nucleoside phosphorylase
VPVAVDKHSTGGVGDKTSLVVEPIVASCGLAVGKMSGRGLGFSGGTIDKLESIPGYRTNLSREEFIGQLKRINLVLTGQSSDLAPADGKLYALRDVTGTVPSIPLIASSIMSKKIAAGAHAIVLDVKVGLGAFMTSLEDAKKLASLMVRIGKLSGRTVIAVLSDMNQPLGRAVGNALEVKEAIDTLLGKGPEDFTEHCLVIASHMLLFGQKASSLANARMMAEKVIKNGKAWFAFRTLVDAQGGDVSAIDHPDRLPQAALKREITSPVDGYLTRVNARIIGEAVVNMGGGRAKKTDTIDHAVGLVVHKKVGDLTFVGEPLLTLHVQNEIQYEQIQKEVMPAFEWSKEPCPPLPLFYGVVVV